MEYRDEHYGNSLIRYDGELIDAADAIFRNERDKNLQEKYLEAEEKVDDLQMTWDDLEEKLEDKAPMHDPRAGNVGATKPGDYRL